MSKSMLAQVNSRKSHFLLGEVAVHFDLAACNMEKLLYKG